LLALVATSADVAAQSIVLETGQTATREAPGATAAFALNPSCALVSVREGSLVVLARAPGTTHVVIVTAGATEQLLVTVRDPVMAASRRDRLRLGSVDFGSAEFRYVSNPSLYQGTLQFARRQGDRETEVRVGGALAVGGAETALVSIPIASYTVRTPRREVTLFDRVVSNSPLTVPQATLRGVHVRDGALQLHAGYNFFANFEDVLLPVNQQAVAGVSYSFPLGRGTLTPNLYYVSSPAAAPSGAIGSVSYEARPDESLRLLAEVGMGTAPAAAGELEWTQPRQRAWSRLRLVPQAMPVVGHAFPAGRLIDTGWNREAGRVTWDLSLGSHRYDLGTSRQASTVGHAAAYYRLTDRWRVHAAPGLSAFDSQAGERAAHVRTVAFPVGVALSSRHVGASAEYQFARETHRNRGGHLVRLGATGAHHGFHYAVSAERQTQAPGLAYLFAELPWLQQALDTLGIIAATPEELATVLRTNARLAALGYTQVADVTLTPERTRLNASGGWSGRGASRPTLWVNSTVTRDELVSRRMAGSVHTVTYAQRARRGADIFASWSLLCAATSRGCQSVVSLSARRRLAGVPGLFFSGKRGEIRGVVFRDDAAVGSFREDLPGLPDVEVVLNGTTRTRTDAHGRYRFTDVSAGVHRVEVRNPSDEPFYFTTPSPTEAGIGTTVNFGVGLLLSRVRGVVTDDAGSPLTGIAVRLQGEGRQESAWTAGDGTFRFDGLPAGDYEVSVDPASVPPGYRLRDLRPTSVRTRPGEPTTLVFAVAATRAISGTVRRFDSATGAYVPLADVTVALESGVQTCVTDASGAYVLRDVSAGTQRVVVRYEGQPFGRTVSVTQGPGLVADVQISIVSVAVHPPAPD
jgi:hypothetical protein